MRAIIANVLEAATEHRKLASPKVHAIVAMSQLALGRVAAAKKTLLKAATDDVGHHAQAAMLAKSGLRAKAIGRLAKVKAANYPEWHWIAVDPNLESLREMPKFQALLQSS